MTGKCTEFYRTGAAGFELVVGNCIYTDHDGDKLFESFDGLKGAWTGGTGNSIDHIEITRGNSGAASNKLMRYRVLLQGATLLLLVLFMSLLRS